MNYELIVDTPTDKAGMVFKLSKDGDTYFSIESNHRYSKSIVEDMGHGWFKPIRILKQPIHDCKIIAFKHFKYGIMFVDAQGYYTHVSSSGGGWCIELEYALNRVDMCIYSIKRLSDGEVFSIGETDCFGVIKSFYIECGSIWVRHQNTATYSLNSLKKVDNIFIKSFTESELVSFGNYLLSDKRKECFHGGSYAEIMERLNHVHDNDLTTWQNEINNMDVE